MPLALFAKQFCRRNGQRFCNSRNYEQAGISLSALDAAHVRQVYFGFERKLLLCHASQATKSQYISTKD
jgi:hypothetical protein